MMDSKRNWPWIVAVLFVTLPFLIPIGVALAFGFIDTFSIPLWLAPSTEKKSVQQALQEDEDVILVNSDTFDAEHINVLTNKRVFCLPSANDGIDYEVPIEQILRVHIDEKDSRIMVIRDAGGHEERVFFVGSPHGFCRRLDKMVRKVGMTKAKLEGWDKLLFEERSGIRISVAHDP